MSLEPTAQIQEAANRLSHEFTTNFAGIQRQAEQIFGFRSQDQHEPFTAEAYQPKLEKQIAQTLAMLIARGENDKREVGFMSTVSFTFKQCFSNDATVYLKFMIDVYQEKRGTWKITMSCEPSVGAPSTTRDIATAVAFANLLTQATNFAALCGSSLSAFTRL